MPDIDDVALRLVHYSPLATDVIAAAKLRIEGTWAAYIGSVPGLCHDDEFEEVLARGAKLPEHIARAIFQNYPDLIELPYAH